MSFGLHQGRFSGSGWKHPAGKGNRAAYARGQQRGRNQSRRLLREISLPLDATLSRPPSAVNSWSRTAFPTGRNPEWLVFGFLLWMGKSSARKL